MPNFFSHGPIILKIENKGKEIMDREVEEIIWHLFLSLPVTFIYFLLDYTVDTISS